MSAPVITLLTDYGLDDEFVGVCHGVIARICPQARVIDVTHGISPQDVLGGALRLAAALPYLPVGIHVAVVDPGVGGERRAVTLRCGDERVLIGPDNGLLWPGAERAGGVREAVEISESPFRLEPGSPTFHGRDVFCPVAAQLAAGRQLSEAGEAIDIAGLTRLTLPEPRVVDGRLIATVTIVDRFGNLRLNCREELGPPGSEVRVAGVAARRGSTFSDAAPGELVIHTDSSGYLALAVNGGSAAERLGVRSGDELEIGPV